MELVMLDQDSTFESDQSHVLNRWAQLSTVLL